MGQLPPPRRDGAACIALCREAGAADSARLDACLAISTSTRITRKPSQWLGFRHFLFKLALRRNHLRRMVAVGHKRDRRRMNSGWVRCGLRNFQGAGGRIKPEAGDRISQIIRRVHKPAQCGIHRNRDWLVHTGRSRGTWDCALHDRLSNRPGGYGQPGEKLESGIDII